MANEITVVERTARNKMKLFFIYPITTPIQVGGSNIIQTPSAEIPTLILPVITGPELATFDAGTAAWEIVNFSADPALGQPALVAKARELYTSHLAAFTQRYNARYEHTGVRVNSE